MRTRKFFAESGVATKVDEGSCVFPVSQRAGDVQDALLRRMPRIKRPVYVWQGCQENRETRRAFSNSFLRRTC